MTPGHSQPPPETPGPSPDGGGRHGSPPICITGGNHVIYQVVLSAGPERDALLAKLQSGQLRHESAPGLAPFPTLILRLAFADASRQQWRVVACQPGPQSVETEFMVPSPFHATTGFAPDLATFQEPATARTTRESESAWNQHRPSRKSITSQSCDRQRAAHFG